MDKCAFSWLVAWSDQKSLHYITISHMKEHYTFPTRVMAVMDVIHHAIPYAFSKTELSVQEIPLPFSSEGHFL